LQAAVLVTLAAFASQTAYVLAAPNDSPSQAAQVDELFSSWSTPTSPGCAIAVLKDERITFQHGYGMADLSHDIKITPDTVFYVGSIYARTWVISVEKRF
jgi:CubicO group peptidase (beta-lactamase class C family)